MTPMVRKKTAHIGCAGQIWPATPISHAPVPTALASREAFKVLIELTPGSTAFVAADTDRVRTSCAADRVPPPQSAEKWHRSLERDRKFSGI
jgi:hypothetical protein